MNSDRPVYSMNVEEFRGFIRDVFEELIDERMRKLQKPHVIVKGVTGFANAIGVSRQTAHRIIKSHQIDAAIRYISPKSFEIDVDEAKNLLTKKRVG